jgi:aspartate/methionine/tyrosine aminotransferase
MKPRLADFPGLFLLKAFTKSYGMAGLRLGYCLTRDHALLRRMGAETQPWNVSVPAQAAGVAALGERAFLQRAKDVIESERPKRRRARGARPRRLPLGRELPPVLRPRGAGRGDEGGGHRHPQLRELPRSR